ncbi:MAG: hypothetical protein WD068_01310 [Candidatus Babeliales bacterium]
MNKQQFLVACVALSITVSLLCVYHISFQRRWPGKHSMNIDALWGTSRLGQTGYFNDNAVLELNQPIDRLRITHENGYQLKVYDQPQFTYMLGQPHINNGRNFELLDNGELRLLKFPFKSQK